MTSKQRSRVESISIYLIAGKNAADLVNGVHDNITISDGQLLGQKRSRKNSGDAEENEPNSEKKMCI